MLDIPELRRAYRSLSKRDEILRDPILNLDVILNDQVYFARLKDRLTRRTFAPVTPAIVIYPKSKGLNRPFHLLGRQDRIVLQAAIVRIGPNLDKLLGPAAKAMRWDKKSH